VGPDDLAGTYKKVHAAIRQDPLKKRGALEKGHFGVRKEPKKEGVEQTKTKHKKHRSKVSNEQRKGRITQLLTARLKKDQAKAQA